MREVLGLKLYTTEESAQIVGVTERTIRAYLKSGKLQGQKVAGNWEISEENIKAFLNGKKPL